MAGYTELQCDGLVGPTHNYAGLSHGNVASTANAARTSSPRRAALQGLEKMRLVASLGVPQLVFPPHPRPRLALLREAGFGGEAPAMLSAAEREQPAMLQAAWSASAMWAANMATVSPAPDTEDGRLHVTPANLGSTLHRHQEAPFNYRLLSHVFGACAMVHAPLPGCLPLTDEGAANHMRLCEAHGEPGMEIFVYGRESRIFPCRQTRHASAALARRHGVRQAMLVQQHPDAIDAGVFHNDVIAMSNERLLAYHELAFAEEENVIEELKRRFPALLALRVTQEELPLAAAVESYFFNSQLLSLPQGGMALIAPQESANNPYASALFERWRQQDDVPINALYYMDLRESMMNGGGPACLRLRVVLSEEQAARIPKEFFYCNQMHERLEQVINTYYPETISPADMVNEATVLRCRKAVQEIAGIFGISGLYEESEWR